MANNLVAGICLIVLNIGNLVNCSDPIAIDNLSSISNYKQTAFLRPSPSNEGTKSVLRLVKCDNVMLANYRDRDSTPIKGQNIVPLSPIDSPYRYTKNGWENLADWHIETKYAEPIPIWVSIHPIVWAGGILLSALMILIGMTRDSEVA